MENGNCKLKIKNEKLKNRKIENWELEFLEIVVDPDSGDDDDEEGGTTKDLQKDLQIADLEKQLAEAKAAKAARAKTAKPGD